MKCFFAKFSIVRGKCRSEDRNGILLFRTVVGLLFLTAGILFRIAGGLNQS